MKNKKTEHVQIMLTYNANNAERDNLRVQIAPAAEKVNTIKKLDDNHKLVRRYSFDDNGGGYLGL